VLEGVRLESRSLAGLGPLLAIFRELLLRLLGIPLRQPPHALSHFDHLTALGDPKRDAGKGISERARLAIKLRHSRPPPV
jgi:hypothetical protein